MRNGIVGVVILLASVVLAQEKGVPAAAKKAQADYARALEKAKADYVKALDAAIKAETMAGNLDVAVAIREEKEAFQRGKPGKDPAPEAIKPARAAFDAARQSAKETCLATLNAALKVETMAGNLDGALALRKVIEAVQKEADPGPAAPAPAAPGAKPGNPFALRHGDLNRIAQDEGGTEASQQAVALALAWLAKVQDPKMGNWSLDRYHLHLPNAKDLSAEADVQKNDTAATGLALLAFLGAGHTHQKDRSPYKKHVLQGLSYLITKQKANGDLDGGAYSHAIAAMALGEAYGLTADPKLRGPTQKALQYIVAAQNPAHGGWRYAPRAADGDVSVTAWQVMALETGRMAGLEVSSTTLDRAARFLDQCGKNDGSKYSYVPGGTPTATMTAAALLCRQYLGWGARHPSVLAGCEFLNQTPPPAAGPAEVMGNSYLYYYATQVLHHAGGEAWDQWNPRMRDHLVRTQAGQPGQEQEPNRKGSWSSEGDTYGKSGGRIYVTALSCLTLEVYYRHVPLHRREGKKE